MCGNWRNRRTYLGGIVGDRVYWLGDDVYCSKCEEKL
jgi:hypothetical protein